ncbi:MAG: PilZ domain-containing protein [Candidatus Omnitrophica bacterium]|nr:PilZ domain-containing protein [Candidatus Omnitrophota bacterium]
MARAYERFELEGRISLQIPDSVIPNIFDANVENISFGGLRMNSLQKIEVDHIINFKLKPALFDELLSGKGKIRYVKEEAYYKTPCYKMGVEFIEVNKDILRYIITQVQNLDNETKRKRQRIQGLETKDIPF